MRRRRVSTLEVEGPSAPESGPVEDNLVLRAARALERRVRGLRLGRFRLVKRLPAAAGLGGGSADAAAALRALADVNGLSIEDERLHAAALEAGADVPVCLTPRARMMVGSAIGSDRPSHFRRSSPSWSIRASPRQLERCSRR